MNDGILNWNEIKKVKLLKTSKNKEIIIINIVWEKNPKEKRGEKSQKNIEFD